MSECNILVAIKMRPLIKREVEKKSEIFWKIGENYLKDTVNHYESEFPFDLIFDEKSTTEDLYKKVAKPIVDKAISGINGTIFAYGQTSSGKTFTMMGDGEQDGLVLMAIKDLFAHIQNVPNQEFVLRVGFIEIYNEKIYDLIDPENVDLQIIEKNKDVLVNFKEMLCKSVEDMYNVVLQGNQNKKMAETDMNERSSRSHTIFHITIESSESNSESVKISNLNLVDLAGSERVSQTNTTGARFVEGAHINKSLLSLSLVINKLINNDGKYINYRDSKLTRYLQSSIGGNAVSAIICTVTPVCLEETGSTLYFAQRAMKVKNKPRVNEIISEATMIKKLHREIEQLQSQLSKERARNEPNIDVPGIMQQLSYHQGNILNYNTIKGKQHRRRTWATFETDMEPIPEIKPRQTDTDLELPEVNRNTPLPIEREVDELDSDDGIGFMDDSDYKTKYHTLLEEFQGLKDFTDAERDLKSEPNLKDDLLEQIDSLVLEKTQINERLQQLDQEKISQEYLFEQHKKKCENREKDLLAMIEDLSKGNNVQGFISEKNDIILELENKLKDSQIVNQALSEKLANYSDIEEKLAKMEHVQIEFEELKNTIIILNNNILVLENEKKEMSVRFNESINLINLDSNPAVSTPPPTESNSKNALKKLQEEHDEMSMKIMDLLQENEELKQKLDDNESAFEKVVLQLQQAQGTIEEQEQMLAANKDNKMDISDQVIVKTEKEDDMFQVNDDNMEISYSETEILNTVNKPDTTKCNCNKQISEIKQALSEIECQKIALEEKLVERTTLITNLQKENDVLFEKNEKFLQNLEIFDGVKIELEKQKTENETLVSKLNGFEISINKLEQEHTTKIEQISILEHQIEESKTTISNMEIQLCSNNDTIKILGEQNTELALKLTAINETNNQVESHLKVPEIIDLEKRMEREICHKNELKNTIIAMESKINEHLAIIQSLKVEKSDLLCQLNDLKENNIRRESESNLKVLDIIELEKQKEQEICRRNTIECELKNTIQELTRKIEEMSEQYQILSEKNAQYEVQLEELRDVANETEDTSQLNNNDNLIDELKEKLNDLECVIESKDLTEKELRSIIELNEVKIKEVSIELLDLQNSKEELLKKTNEFENDKILLMNNNSDLEEALKVFEENNLITFTEMKNKIEELENEKNVFINENESLKNEIVSSKLELQNKLEIDVSNMELTLNKQISEVSKLEDERNTLLSDLRNQAEVIEAKRLKIDELEIQLKEKELIVSNLESEMEKLEHSAANMSSSYGSLKNEIDELKIKYDVLIQERAEKEDEFIKLENKLEIMRQSETNFLEQCTLLESEKTEKNLIISELKSKIDEFETSKMLCNQQIESLKVQIDALQMELNAKSSLDTSNNEECFVLKKQIQSLILDLAKTEEERNTLLSNSKNLTEIVDAKSTALNTLELELKQKELKCMELENLIEKLELSAAELSNINSDISKEKEELKIKVDSLAQERDNNTKKIDELNMNIEQFTESNTLLKTEIENLKEEKISLNSEFQRLKTEFVTLSEEKLQLKHDHGKLMKNLENMDCQLAEMQNMIKSVEDKSAVKEEELNLKINRIAELEGELLELKKSNSCLEVLKTNYEKLMNNHKEMEIKCNNLAQEKELLLKNTTELKEKLQIIVEKHAESLEQSIAQFAEEKRQMNDEVNKQRDENQALQKKLFQTVEENLSLQKKIEDANSDAEIKTLKEQIQKDSTELSLLKIKYKQLSTAADQNKVQAEQLTLERNRTKDEMSSIKEKLLELKQKHGIIQDELKKKTEKETELLNKIQTLEFSELSSRGDFKLQNSERRARRSSTFNNNRNMLSSHDIGTMTDPTSELCSCTSLDKKVKELKKEILLKNCEIYNLKDVYKSSPMLLENYEMKRKIVEFKTKAKETDKEIARLRQDVIDAMREAQRCKVCERNQNRSTNSISTQVTLELDEVKNMKTQLDATNSKYAEARNICLKRNNKIKELEELLSNLKKNQHANIDDKSKESSDYQALLRKYVITRKIVEQRKETILELEAVRENFPKTCSKCGENIQI